MLLDKNSEYKRFGEDEKFNSCLLDSLYTYSVYVLSKNPDISQRFI